jgi:putative transposase
MPSRNLEKIYLSDSYYHIYNRGINKQTIFLDSEDYAVFLNLLKRYLNSIPVKDKKGREYEWLHEKIELLAFCLMPNHFHLLIYQSSPEAMTRLLRGIGTSYTTYFNKKYKRRGPLFESRFKASVIQNESYLLHISRYIHLNPNDYRHYEWSSLPYYLGNKQAAWIRPKRILDIFENDDYSKFVSDYEEHKEMLDEIKHELADL